MAYDVQKLLDIALNEVGYLEKETYDQLDEKTTNAGDENYTKYQRDLAKLNYFNSSKKGIAWCAVFVCWCFVQAFGKAAALKLLCQPSSGNCGAGCTSQMNYYKNKKQFYTDGPKVGDQIIFWSSDKTEASHTGLVYKVDNTYVYTVEGNTSSAKGVVANGGAVATKKYKLTYERIAGYGRPIYGTVDSSDNEETINESVIQEDDGTLEKGDKGENVKKLQIRLNELGYYKSTLDGSYGNVTMTAVKAFQKDNSLPQTGIADLATQEKLYSDSDNKEEGISHETVDIPGMVTGDAWVSVTNGSTVNYRQRPDLSSPKVVGMPRIKQGEQVYIKTSDGTWAAVEYKGYRGYVMMEFLTQKTFGSNEEPIQQPEDEVPVVTPEVSTEQRTYTTVKGDTLWKISARFLGAGYKYKKIMEANGMKNTIVRPGMVLKIPNE